jgi:cytochrome c peroxidase
MTTKPTPLIPVTGDRGYTPQFILDALGFVTDGRAKKTHAQALAPPPLPKENWTLKQIATRWEKSEDFVRDWFRDARGVLSIDRPEKKGKHRYSPLLIPEVVLFREESKMRVR